MRVRNIVLALTLVSVLLICFMIGCTGGTDSTNSGTSSTGGDKGTIELVYVQWACAEAETYVAEAVLEDIGYDVEKSVVETGVMWESVAKGDMDAFTTAWLPYSQQSYWEKYKDQVEDLGSLFDDAVLAIVAPSYVTIDSIAEMKDYEEEFNKQIVGIDPGAGIMQHTSEDTMPAYGLEDWTLVESSGPAMVAELDRAYNKGEWIAVTGWKPHYMFFPYDLKLLEDPQNTLGKAEEIRVIARQGFSEDMPDAANVLRNMFFTDAQLGEVMYNINVEGIDPEEAARNWVDENPNVIDEWIV